MKKKKILLFQPDKEAERLFGGWLNAEGYEMVLLEKLESARKVISDDGFDLFIIDIDVEGTAHESLRLCRALKKDPLFRELPVTFLTYRKNVHKIIAAIEAGADNFVLKPFKEEMFLKRLKVILEETELKARGKKVLDLNYVNYMFELAGEAGRDDFFIFADAIFNNLIIGKVIAIIGGSIFGQIVKRANEAVGDEDAFMKEIHISDERICLDDVKRVSGDMPVAKLVRGFKGYIYIFLRLLHVLTSDILMSGGKGAV